MSNDDPEIPQPSYRDRIAILPGDPPIAYRPCVVPLDETARPPPPGEQKLSPVFVVGVPRPRSPFDLVVRLETEDTMVAN